MALHEQNLGSLDVLFLNGCKVQQKPFILPRCLGNHVEQNIGDFDKGGRMAAHSADNHHLMLSHVAADQLCCFLDPVS